MNNIVATAEEPTLRQKPKEIEPQNDISLPKEENVPLEIFERENHRDYIYDLFDMVSDLPVLPTETKQTIDKINQYIIDLMSKTGYKTTTESYKATLDGLKKDLGINENVALETTIERLSKYIEAEQLLKSLKSLDEDKLLKQLKHSPDKDMISLVMKQIAKSTF
jgi:hypothetical protein